MVEGKRSRNPAGGARGGHPHVEKDEGEVRWLISYSDFMMQLVCLFLLLYSVSSLDATKAAPIAQSWREVQGIQPVVVAEGPPPGASAVPLTLAELPATLKDIEVVLAQYPEGAHIRVTPNTDGFRLQLIYEMFEEGSLRLTPPGERLADLAALILRPYQPRVLSIEIVGHAAAVDADREEGSALHLSLSRSREVYRQVTRKDLPQRLGEKNLGAAGQGAYDPVADNGSPVIRALNRRADFLVRFPEPSKP